MGGNRCRDEDEDGWSEHQSRTEIETDRKQENRDVWLVVITTQHVA